MLKAFVNYCIWMVGFCLENSFQLLRWGWSHLKSPRSARVWLGLRLEWSHWDSLTVSIFNVHSTFFFLELIIYSNVLPSRTTHAKPQWQSLQGIRRSTCLSSHLPRAPLLARMLEHWLPLTLTYVRHWGQKTKIWRPLVPALKELQR